MTDLCKPSRCIKASFYIPGNWRNFPTTRSFLWKSSMKLLLFYQYVAIFINLPPTSSHLHPLQAENCDSNSRLVVDEDDNGKFRPERVKMVYLLQKILWLKLITCTQYLKSHRQASWTSSWITRKTHYWSISVTGCCSDSNPSPMIIYIFYVVTIIINIKASGIGVQQIRPKMTLNTC